jgi:tetratricopeptide (TPR) repeat protein
MFAYQQAANLEKVQAMARQILAVNPDSIRALAVLAYLDRVKATSGDQPALKEACDYAQKGLQAMPAWPRPEGISDSDFEKLRNQMSEVFYGTSGFCALQAKDYVTARTDYQKSFEIDPANMQDVYQLGLACSLMSPMDINGLWYLAKAINLATAQNNSKAAEGIATYAKARYKYYHGGDDGWDQLVAAAASQTAPVVDKITPAPTKCDIAAEAVEKNKVEELSFSDWEFVLAQRDCGPKGKDAADKVWQAIQTQEKNGQTMLKIPAALVIAANDSTLDVAITEDNQKSGKADMHVVLQKPVPHPPAPGSTTDVVGVITSYTVSPFMFTMEKASLPAAEVTPGK